MSSARRKTSAIVAGLALMPAAMLIAAMFFTSTYFSFRDCFDTSTEEAP